MKRVWTYEKNSWEPKHWWNALGVPERCQDDYGRLTWVWGFWFIGYVVIAYKTCHCEDCVDQRLWHHLKEQHDEEFADEVIEYRIRVRSMPKDGTRRV
jgi:hypothetical protein